MKHLDKAIELAREVSGWPIRYEDSSKFIPCLTSRLCRFASEIARRAREQEAKKFRARGIPKRKHPWVLHLVVSGRLACARSVEGAVRVTTRRGDLLIDHLRPCGLCRAAMSRPTRAP